MKARFWLCAFIGCVILSLFLESDLIAQTSTNEILLTEGLVIRLPRVRRALPPIDPIEKMLVVGNWVSPKAGDKITVGDEEAIWESITADETGWFSSDALRGGYAYIPFESDKDKIMLLEGMGHDMVYINGIPRMGNMYGTKDTWESWEPAFNYSILPVELKKGKNELLFRGSRAGRLKVKLYEPESSVLFNTKDRTLPDFILGEAIDTWGAVVVINASHEPLKNLKISAKIGNNEPAVTRVPIIAPMTIRKIGFLLQGEPPTRPDLVDVSLQLHQNDQLLDEATLQVGVKNRLEPHKRTFISSIDGGVQHYAINPAQSKDPAEPVALILSVHGAGVEALNQAASYSSKTWAHIVAPTNRRPYGFNWEDWGRLDALEVYDLAMTEYNIDPNRIYLSGHSMGGHGTYHLGALFPDRFGAIGPSAGWLSFWSYRVRERIEEDTPMAKMLMRPTLPSNTFVLAPNYNQLGVYIIHGSNDDNVPVEQSRQMAAHLEKFHKDFIYHEQAGAGHWWDNSDEPGADCQDWPALMDFFARHARPGKERVRQIEFLVANPGISAQNNWVCVEAQQQQLSLSMVKIQFDPGKKRFVGTTENVARLSLDVGALLSEGPVSVELDSQKIENIGWNKDVGKIWLQRKTN
ncbi:MAG: prolyl oligopeptidase family serine peptidase, partial [candidate division KSB1 bacterium]|nr:prolyl oligopeptidase family serine peptidase [candidate division KSB1 bacterium]